MEASQRGLLAVNAGSSSIKVALYAIEEARLELLARTEVAGIGERPRLRIDDGHSKPLTRELDASASHGSALREALEWMHQRFPSLQLVGAGHRVVHGGTRFIEPTQIDRGVIVEVIVI